MFRDGIGVWVCEFNYVLKILRRGLKGGVFEIFKFFKFDCFIGKSILKGKRKIGFFNFNIFDISDSSFYDFVYVKSDRRSFIRICEKNN